MIMLAKLSNEVQKRNMLLQTPIWIEFQLSLQWKHIRSLITWVARLMVGDTKTRIQFCLTKISTNEW